MRIGQGNPRDIIHWFQDSSPAHWLGFFLAGDEKYNKLMNSVLEKADLFDTISGRPVDLFVFDTGQTLNLKSGGTDINVDATPLTMITQYHDHDSSEEWARRARAAHLTISGIADVNLTAARRKAIAKLSGRATNDLVEALGLGVDDLPSLVLLRKDFDFRTKQPVLILRTRGQADAEFLVEFIRSVRRLYEAQQKAQARLEFKRFAGPEVSVSKEIDSVPAGQRRAERQAAFLSSLVKNFGIELAAASIVTHLFSAPSAREGIERAFAEAGVTDHQLQEMEHSDLRMRNVCLELQRARERIDNVMHVSESYVKVYETNFAEFENLISQFDRKISFRIAADHVVSFFQISTSLLKKTKSLIRLLGAVKSGGTSLLG
jgi:hypothetical protein